MTPLPVLYPVIHPVKRGPVAEPGRVYRTAASGDREDDGCFPMEEGTMSMDDRKSKAEDPSYGVDLHPRHEAWARITTRSSLIGLVIFLVLAAAFVLWVQWR